MSKVFVCKNCNNVYQTDGGLRKHYRQYPSHKPDKSQPESTAEIAVRHFLDTSLTYRRARLKELVTHLSDTEANNIFLGRVTKVVSTYNFLLKKC